MAPKCPHICISSNNVNKWLINDMSFSILESAIWSVPISSFLNQWLSAWQKGRQKMHETATLNCRTLGGWPWEGAGFESHSILCSFQNRSLNLYTQFLLRELVDGCGGRAFTSLFQQHEALSPWNYPQTKIWSRPPSFSHSGESGRRVGLSGPRGCCSKVHILL